MMSHSRSIFAITLFSCTMLGFLLFGCGKTRQVTSPVVETQVTLLPAANTTTNWPHVHDIESLAQLNHERYEKNKRIDTLKNDNDNIQFDALDDKYKNYYQSMQLLSKAIGYDTIPHCHDLAEERENKAFESVISQVDLDAKNEVGNTILHSLVSCQGSEGSDIETTKDLTLVYTLLDRGADITQTGTDNETLLMMTHFLPTAERFFKAKGDVNAKNVQGKTALHFQVNYEEQMRCENFFFEEKSMGCVNNKENECITHADVRRTQMTELIKQIIAAGGDVNAKDQDGISPVMISTLAANAPKANINDVDALGRSVFMHQMARFVFVPQVCSKPDIDNFLKLGTDIHYINPQNGYNALVYAVELRRDLFEYNKNHCFDKTYCIMHRGENDEISLNPSVAGKYMSLDEVHHINDLLHYEYAAYESLEDTNAKTPDDTRLELSLSLIETLLKSGADIHIQTKDGKNAIMERVNKDDEALIQVLKKYGFVTLSDSSPNS